MSSQKNPKIFFRICLYYRASMQSDMGVYRSALEQQGNANTQIHSLQDKLTREKNEFDEVWLTEKILFTD